MPRRPQDSRSSSTSPSEKYGGRPRPSRNDPPPRNPDPRFERPQQSRRDADPRSKASSRRGESPGPGGRSGRRSRSSRSQTPSGPPKSFRGGRLMVENPRTGLAVPENSASLNRPKTPFNAFIQRYISTEIKWPQIYQPIESIVLALAYRDPTKRLSSPGVMLDIGAALYSLYRNVVRGILKDIRGGGFKITNLAGLMVPLFDAFMGSFKANQNTIRRMELGLSA